jgi:transposase-like protein
MAYTFILVSRSFRLAARYLESIAKRSDVSVWKWVQKYSSFADRLSSVVNKAAVKKIFVDETLIQIDGQKYCGCG